MKKATFLSVLLLFSSVEVLALQCRALFNANFTISDQYRAYAIGERDAQGVKRIHVVNFNEPTLKIHINQDKLTQIVTQREQFHDPSFKQSNVQGNFKLYIPRHPLQTSAEFTGARGREIRARMKELFGNVVYNFTPPKKLSRFEYRPQDSPTDLVHRDMMFLVELKTADELIELVLRKDVVSITRELEIVNYALYVASQLNLDVESVWAVRIGYD